MCVDSAAATNVKKLKETKETSFEKFTTTEQTSEGVL